MTPSIELLPRVSEIQPPLSHPSKSIPTIDQVDIQSDQQHLSNLDSYISKLSSKYSNPSLHVTPDHTISLIDTPIPRPSPTQVLIHIRATGICGSDLHLWHRGAIGPLVVDRPCILGHEASGVVLAIGSNVTNLQPGDKIAIEPGVPCNTCFLCTSGKYNLCEKVAFAGVCPHAGSIRRFMTHEARYCHKLPESMTFAQGALLEPLSVVLHAINQCHGSIKIGRPALICGAGPIGLIALAAARASGAWPLVITDIDESRLKFARTFVPGVKTYLVDPAKSAIESAREIRQLYLPQNEALPSQNSNNAPLPNLNTNATVNTEREDIEYLAPSTVLECTGTEPSIITAAHTVRRAGTLMIIGVGRSTMNNLPFMHLSLSEVEMRFINRYVDTWPAGINALSKEGGVLDLDCLVTHRVPLERAVEAFEISANRGSGSVKVLIVDDEEIKGIVDG